MKKETLSNRIARMQAETKAEMNRRHNEVKDYPITWLESTRNNKQRFAVAKVFTP